MTFRWQLPTQTLTLPSNLTPLSSAGEGKSRPLIMGIINATPDSFSDGGRYDPVAQGLQLVEQGADILDIGGESTRPSAVPVEVAEELRRVIPVIAALAQKVKVPLSIDTTKAQVAREALAAGAVIINDISALEADDSMVQVAIDTGAAIVAMHRQGTPQTMQNDPHYENVVEEVADYLKLRLSQLAAAGIAPDRVVVDPGIGFGKRTQHNLQLLGNLDRLIEAGRPILLGVSRKGFIHRTLGTEAAVEVGDFGTVGLMLHAYSRGWVQIARVHHVAGLSAALGMFQAVEASTNP